MEAIHGASRHLSPALLSPLIHRIATNPLPASLRSSSSIFQPQNPRHRTGAFSDNSRGRNTRPPPMSAGWFLGFADKKDVLPDVVKAGDPVLHEPASDVPIGDIGSEKIEKIIEDMVAVMRKAPGVGLAAPQIGIPLRIIVLEDTNTYISYARKEEVEAQDRRPFDLLVILNPVLKRKNNKTALFFEGCLSVDGYRAIVERNLEVEVTGLGRDGQPIRIDARGWQARILQHECDHLDGTIYVDKMLPKTFRTVENLELPLPRGCPNLGVCKFVPSTR